MLLCGQRTQQAALQAAEAAGIAFGGQPLEWAAPRRLAGERQAAAVGAWLQQAAALWNPGGCSKQWPFGTGRWQQLPRGQRHCPHCGGDIDTVLHMICDCPLHAHTRQRFADLVFPMAPLLRSHQALPSCGIPRLVGGPDGSSGLRGAARGETQGV